METSLWTGQGYRSVTRGLGFVVSSKDSCPQRLPGGGGGGGGFCFCNFFFEIKIVMKQSNTVEMKKKEMQLLKFFRLIEVSTTTKNTENCINALSALLQSFPFFCSVDLRNESD